MWTLLARIWPAHGPQVRYQAGAFRLDVQHLAGRAIPRRQARRQGGRLCPGALLLAQELRFFGLALVPGLGLSGSAAGAGALIPGTTRTILPASMCLSTAGSLKSWAAIIT